MSDTPPSPPVDAGSTPTGWAVIAKNESVVDIVDALLDLPSHREFHKSELAKLADVSRKSVHRHIDLLLWLGILVEVPNTTPQCYRFNPESDVSKALIRLDGAVIDAGPKSDSTPTHNP